jgi:hypothetical protein
MRFMGRILRPWPDGPTSFGYGSPVRHKFHFCMRASAARSCSPQKSDYCRGGIRAAAPLSQKHGLYRGAHDRAATAVTSMSDRFWLIPAIDMNAQRYRGRFCHQMRQT